MPFGDWQFWVVSLLAAGAALLVLGPMLRRFGNSGSRTTSTRTHLTVKGRSVRRGKRAMSCESSDD